MTINDLLASGRATISISEAADLLGLDPRTVSRHLDEGVLPHISVGRRTLVLVKPLLQILGA
jgi:excisionase family DNA binding protein